MIYFLQPTDGGPEDPWPRDRDGRRDVEIQAEASRERGMMTWIEAFHSAGLTNLTDDQVRVCSRAIREDGARPSLRPSDLVLASLASLIVGLLLAGWIAVDPRVDRLQQEVAELRRRETPKAAPSPPTSAFGPDHAIGEAPR